MKRKIAVVIFFIIALYLVEAGPFGSSTLAEYNGYGTFDMKSYNMETITEVLNGMPDDVILREYAYYVMDFIFIAALFLFQYTLAGTAFEKIAKIMNITAFARGVCDVVENVSLIIAIARFPAKSAGLIAVTSQITKVKIALMPIWLLLLAAGLVAKRIYRRKTVEV